MYCPSCGGEFREGITFCANCEVDLVDEAPREDPFDSEETMAALLADKDLQAVVVGSYASVRENQRALAKARIPSVIAPEDEGAEIQAGMHSRLYLLVDANDLDRVQRHFAERLARGLAAEGLMLPGAGAAPKGEGSAEDEGAPCPACGTPVPATVEECPDCGLVVGPAGGPGEEADEAEGEGDSDEAREA